MNSDLPSRGRRVDLGATILLVLCVLSPLALSFPRSAFASDDERRAERKAADELLRAGKLEEAQSAWEEIVANVRALLDAQRENNDAGERRARDLRDELAESLGSLALTVRKRGDHRAALAHRREALQVLAGDPAIDLAKQPPVEGEDWKRTAARWRIWTLEKLIEGDDASREAYARSRALRKRAFDGYRARDWKTARASIEEEIGILEKLFGPVHPQSAEAWLWASRVGQRARDAKTAIEAAEKCIEIAHRAFGGASPEAANAEAALGALHTSLRDRDKAREHFERADGAYRAARGETHDHTLINLHNHAHYALQLGDARGALRVMDELARRLDGADRELSRIDVAFLKTRARILRALHRLDEALETQGRVLETDAAIGTETADDRVIVLRDMASLERGRSRNDKALEFAQRAVAEAEKGPLRNPEQRGYAWGSLGKCYRVTYRYTEGETAHQKALEILTQVLGPEHPQTLNVQNNLGALYVYQGNFVASRLVHEKTLATRRRVLPPVHPDTAYSLDNLGDVLRLTGDYERALELTTEGLEMRRKIYRGPHLQVATSLDNLGSVFGSMDRREEALKCYQEALAIREKQLGAHYSTGITYNNIAVTLKELGRYDEAMEIYAKVLEMYRELGTADGSRASTTLQNLGLLHLEKGECEGGRRHIERALEQMQARLGQDHPFCAEVLGNLALARLCSGDRDAARIAIEKALAINRRVFDVNAPLQGELEQIASYRKFRKSINIWLDLGDAVPVDEAYAQVLAWKGVVFLRQQSLRSDTEDPETSRLRGEFLALSRQLAALFSTPLGEESAEARRKRVAELATRKEALERQLAERDGAFSEARQRDRVDLRTLRASLGEDTALVDFIEYTRLVRQGGKLSTRDFESHLAAFLLRPGKPIQRIEFGPAADLLDAAAAWREALGVAASVRGARGEGSQTTRGKPGDGESADTGKPAAEDEATVATEQGEDASAVLRRRLWQPIAEHLDADDTVLVVPDGFVSWLPISALPGEKRGSYLIEERRIATVPFAQLLPELVGKRAPRKEAEHDLLLVGAIDYGLAQQQAAEEGHQQETTRKAPVLKKKDADGAPEGVAREEETQEGETRRARRGSRHRTRWTAPVARDLTSFAALPFTEAEIHALRGVQATVKRQSKIELLVGKRATEGAFYELAPRSRIVHLATHGFFARPAGSGPTEVSSRWHPGLLSGLVFAGANRAPEIGGDDGIVTSLELSAVDLNATDLLVLSACETALGSVQPGEGLLGLQRACHMAGARSVLTSLWQVRDAETQSLMLRFYENIWKRGLGRLDALRDAQLAMLRGELHIGASGKRGPGPARAVQRDPSTATPRRPPSAWAAWILSGDWR